MTDRRGYRVIFYNKGEVYEIYAKSISQGMLLGFVEVEELRFGDKSKVVVDPSEESLRNEFKGVKRIYIPMHSIVRIDEVEKEGVSKITPRAKGEGTIAPFPTPIYNKPRDDPGQS